MTRAAWRVIIIAEAAAAVITWGLVYLRARTGHLP